MDAFLEKQLLILARELSASHGTCFTAVLLSELGVPLELALKTLVRRPRSDNVIFV